MIISCEKCNKSFRIQDNLIPAAGRLVECGSCSYKWKQFPIIEEKKDQKDKIILKDKIIEKKITSPQVIKNKKIKTKETKKMYDLDLYKEEKKIGFLNILLVLIISFIAIVIFLDTFKNELSDIFPQLNFYLDSFYETIKDVFLFTKDLIK